MIQLHTGRPSRPGEGRPFLYAFVILTVLLFGFDHARRVHNSHLDSSGKPLFPYLSSSITGHGEPKEAKIISAQELLARPLATDLTTVPKIFHQSWNNSTLPGKFEKWSRSCRRAHPDWEWVLWTDQDNMDLVHKHASWFADTFEDLDDQIPVFRADAARNLYMHVYGGVYADLDVECLEPTETLIETYGVPGRQAFLGRMGTENNGASLPNAWFASTPGHPFWVLPLEYIQENIDIIVENAEGLTGPGNLFNMVNRYDDEYTMEELNIHYAQSGWRHLFRQVHQEDKDSFQWTQDEEQTNHTLTILPFWEIYPYSWLRDGESVKNFCWTRAEEFNETTCKLLLGTDHRGSHTITYWSHSWANEGNGHDGIGLKSIMEDNVEDEIDG